MPSIQRPLPVRTPSPPTAGWLLVAALAVAALPAPAAAQTYPSSAGNLVLQTVARGLDHPWALAFLPDGRMLVTERPGRLRIVSRDGKLSPPVAGLPKVYASGQGGLLDVMPRPRLRAEPDDLFLLRRSGERRRAHRARQRAAGRRGGRAAPRPTSR